MAETSFWKKPEGKLGIAVSVLLGAGFLYGLYIILPFLITLAANTLILGLYCVAIAVLFYVTVLDSGLRNMLVNFYKRAIRALYILSFNVDPIGGLKDRIVELRERVELAKKKAGEVKGQAHAVQKTIDANDAVYQRGLDLMATAQRQGMADKARAEGIKAQVAKEANAPLIQLKSHLERTYTMLTDIIGKSEINVDVLNTVVTVKERSFKASKAGRSALRAAMAALKGDPEGNDRFQENLNWIDEYTADVMGEIDAVLDLNKNALNSIDLEQQSYSDKAFAALEARQRATQHLLSGDARAQKLLSAPFSDGFKADAAVATQAVPVSAGDFSHILKKK